MTINGFLQIVLYFTVLLLLVKPLGHYMASVYENKSCGLDRLLGPIERGLYRFCGVHAEREMTWREYAAALLIFNVAGFILLYALLCFQGSLPLNPRKLPSLDPVLAFNVAVSFVTNTNWQSYSGEMTMSYLSQMAGLTVQNFLSAATGMAVLVALIRGLKRRLADKIGNFWVDAVRSILYILLPLSMILALLLVSQGVVQSLSPSIKVNLMEAAKDRSGNVVMEQAIPLGPAASQIAIKQLGTNGGGFFNANSAHPLENPTPVSNFLELLAILLIPAALCYTYGKMAGDTRQGWTLLATMFMILIPLMTACLWSEQAGNPYLSRLGIDQSASDLHPGGNMEGKEIRFGIVNSVLWATATTAASNGSVNAMHDSFTAIGGLVPLWLMQLGEIIFGGAGSGLYGMVVFALITVFISGLMVGRTPEYLGKKIGAFEMQMASLVILIPAAIVLFGTAVAVVTKAGLAGIQNTGPHGFTEILYAFSSAGNNNGSAFAGLDANTDFYNVMLGLAMIMGRFGAIIPILAIAGSLARKKTIPSGLGTLPTHTFLFAVLLTGVILIVGALSFLPALSLGPIVEYMTIPK
ncbi:MAG: potassium-transporting ATPase subunit KdpA [Syntrophus sp. (in: bacteria)]|nr:potassium-transporting ATPase subunit KdpA [Syntrophus sp. (in: bacteria)]